MVYGCLPESITLNGSGEVRVSGNVDLRKNTSSGTARNDRQTGNSNSNSSERPSDRSSTNLSGRKTLGTGKMSASD
eukprot:CAMPEP_0172374714 /NCGR_PEP_ID=MMETSP1060-20121228/57161_1 /TAXON_ID=37318 /ORGANISM="Pseudo-nitzschia pungens, Strain cf. cingulata" /LENGTH=75 /DNA_ID=CAMNT_0013101503 /DNA_START=48 /DNA_END=275 /DNA_ORIENTATION=+